MTSDTEGRRRSEVGPLYSVRLVVAFSTSGARQRLRASGAAVEGWSAGRAIATFELQADSDITAIASARCVIDGIPDVELCRLVSVAPGRRLLEPAI